MPFRDFNAQHIETLLPAPHDLRRSVDYYMVRMKSRSAPNCQSMNRLQEEWRK